VIVAVLLCGARVGVTSLSPAGEHTAVGASVMWAVAGGHAARTSAAPACSAPASRPYSIRATECSLHHRCMLSLLPPVQRARVQLVHGCHPLTPYRRLRL
jgi:hypothetical protein